MTTAGYEAIIGLECHVQLRTRSKMFCTCPVQNEGAPNATICPVCMGHPGTLPMLNRAAVSLGLRAGLALGATLHPESIFSRKHYFYPDLPKGYQISQYDRPLCTGGVIHTELGPLKLTRIQLEEDAGRMLHGDRSTVVDWNRAGTPLIEIVSEADLRSPEHAELAMRTLHRVLVEGGICVGDMEKGHLRCDVNVSVHRPGTPWGTKVEVKNVNSFRFVARAIRFEIERQIDLLDAGQRIIQETRTWDGSKTVSLRKKEGSADYRYFPEPDLPPLVVAPDEVAEARAALPGVPLDLWLAARDVAARQEWRDRYGLGDYDIGVITGDPDLERWFLEAVAAGGQPRAMSSWVQGEVQRRNNIGQLGQLAPRHLVEAQRLLDAGAVNRDAVKALLENAANTGVSPEAEAEAQGLSMVSDEEALRRIAAEVVARFPQERARYDAGNKGMLGFFMGKFMAATERRADPKIGSRVVLAALEKR